MRLVFDSCVLVKVLADEPGSATARKLFAEATVHIPDWGYMECSHALLKKHRDGVLAEHEVRDRLSRSRRLDVETHEGLPLLERASELAMSLAHDVYDCMYLALGIAEACPVVTVDKRFLSAARANGFAEAVRGLEEFE